MKKLKKKTKITLKKDAKREKFKSFGLNIKYRSAKMD